MNAKLHISPQSEENFLPTQTLVSIQSREKTEQLQTHTEPTPVQLIAILIMHPCRNSMENFLYFGQHHPLNSKTPIEVKDRLCQIGCRWLDEERTMRSQKCCQLPKKKSKSSPITTYLSLLRNKSLLLRQNASKFAIFLEYENPCRFFFVFHSVLL